MKLRMFHDMEPENEEVWEEEDASKESLVISPKYIYRLNPAPPKWELQEYIRAYCEEKNDMYLSWFLHYYEHTLNRKAEKYTDPYKQDGLFGDIKQAIVLGMYKALKNYDISQYMSPLYFTKSLM